MDSEIKARPIGIFDSGVGGISVLGKMVQELPQENFVFLADTANAPYGTKTTEEVRGLSIAAAQRLQQEGIKALVIACNTATSAAVNHLRKSLDIPVIGMEPALKPAVENTKSGSVVVLATTLTLAEKKFRELMARFQNTVSIVPIPCPGLVELIESNASQQEIVSYIRGRLNGLNPEDISAVVLGCTHYWFVKEEVTIAISPKVQIFDGYSGTVRHLIAIMEELGIQTTVGNGAPKGSVKFISTAKGDEPIKMCYEFFKKAQM